MHSQKGSLELLKRGREPKLQKFIMSIALKHGIKRKFTQYISVFIIISLKIDLIDINIYKHLGLSFMNTTQLK